MLWSFGRVVGLSSLAIAVLATLILLFPRRRLPAGADQVPRWRRRMRFAALLGGLVAWGLAPFWAISDGIERFDRHTDPAYAWVAQQAYNDAWIHNDNPITRLALPAVRVRRVWRDPGHCPRGDPGSAEPYADWRADVRFYTYFGIPGPTLRVTCGGWAW